MSGKQKILVLLVAAGIVAIGWLLYNRGWFASDKRAPISLDNKGQSTAPVATGPANTGPVSPISGLPCENYKGRPFAVMQPVDVQARPTAGFSQAEIVFEMPNPAEGVFVTRMMGVYLCNIPPEIGAIRSARHEYMSVAKGLDAVFIGWGGSAFALKKLNEGVIDNIDCNGQGGKKAPECCFRKERTGLMRGEDTGFIKGDKMVQCAKDFGYRQEGKFSGYPHQEDAALEARPDKGHLRIGYPGMMEAEYDYDKQTNAYLRTWGGTADVDRNNNQRIAPKNIVVMIAENEQIMADVDYKSRGVQDPWEGLEDWEKTGPRNISGRYNNIQMGDPWFDTKDSGEAHYYFNGKEYRGTWKKDKASVESKLTFYDDGGQEVKFVPGEIWVEVMVPGQKFEWSTM